jgi:arabinan endo-1,5-alpha-L-arabinosidase
MAQSDDLINWNSLNSSIDATNYLTLPDKTWKENLAEPLKWTTDYQRLVGVAEDKIEYNCWANNIVYNKKMGKYCLYGCCSVWGTVISVVWLAVSDNIEGPYEYSGSIVYSGLTVYDKAKDKDYLTPESKAYCEAMDYSNTNLKAVVDAGYINKSSINSTEYADIHNFTDYNGFYLRYGAGEFPNAIDPTAFFDAMGDLWLVYGSYSGGCYVIKLDAATGLADYSYMKKISGFNVYFGKQISKTNEETDITGEGPFIVYDKTSRYYYFFLTYGGLDAADGYNIREYRSKSPAGPYEDAAGNSALDMKNTGLKLMGNYQFDCQKTAYLSGGHSSCLIDSDGLMYQAYHTRFTADGGWGHQMRIHKMARTSDGWAVLLPFEYQGDVSKKVESADIAGTYEFIDSTNMTQKKETEESPFSDIILPKQYIKLNSDGTISNIKDYFCSKFNTNTGFEEVSGTWSVSGSNAYASFKIGDVSYKGVFAYQKDESKDAKTVLTFSLAGNDNSTIWGAKHSHTNKQISKTAATTSKDGKIEYECTLCGEKSSKTINKPTAFTLSKTSYVYDGKEKKPSVTVKDSKGNTIDKSNYSLSYTANKAVGTAKVKVSFKNNYSGSKTISYKINPKATSFKTPSITKNAITLKWNKQATHTTGYEVVFSDNSSFKKAKTYKIASKTTSKKFTKLKSKKTYYFKIRTYKRIGSTYYYSSWTKKSIKTK